jgi:hypothetical protein
MKSKNKLGGRGQSRENVSDSRVSTAVVLCLQQLEKILNVHMWNGHNPQVIDSQMEIQVQSGATTGVVRHQRAPTTLLIATLMMMRSKKPFGVSPLRLWTLSVSRQRPLQCRLADSDTCARAHTTILAGAVVLLTIKENVEALPE